jgi:hypothetical protein
MYPEPTRVLEKCDGGNTKSLILRFIIRAQIGKEKDCCPVHASGIREN